MQKMHNPYDNSSGQDHPGWAHVDVPDTEYTRLGMIFTAARNKARPFSIKKGVIRFFIENYSRVMSVSVCVCLTVVVLKPPGVVVSFSSTAVNCIEYSMSNE